MNSLQVDLGARSYPIEIGQGLLDGLGDGLKPLLKGRQMAVLTTETVAPLYLERAQASLTAAGFDVTPIILPDGETSKSWQALNQVFDVLIGARFERSSTVVALGGGVIGDLSGFAAASLLRGVNFVQVPTTLLSQVDSSVGGKTGINHPLGKNLIGAFYQPKKVTIDIDTLRTLPRRELLAGLAEVIKYGIIWDAELFARLERDLDAFLALEPTVVAEVIHRCCAIKAEVVSADEREAGQRALLNLGHTFGHAIENLAGYGEILHGEAVAIGMVMAADLSHWLKLCPGNDVARIRELVERAGLPLHAPKHAVEAYMDAMSRDKKVEAGVMRFVLMRGIGSAMISSDVDAAVTRQVIEAYAVA
ncbi:3-dehydroquinate synthase [Magnetofaba australis]|uniref:3-dehydroquinate synthase n=1 Tax=Magnetofaba australis TaxID=1472297 RepID=UPI000A19B9E6